MRGAAGAAIALLIGANQFGGSQHMALHRCLQIGLRRPAEVECRVERVELVKIAMPADGRAWTAILRLPRIGDATRRAWWQAGLVGVLREPASVGGNVVKDP